MGKVKQDDSLYQIDQIVDHRRIANSRTVNRLEYLVKWLNYDNRHNSWIPADNFFSQKMVHDYHARHNLILSELNEPSKKKPVAEVGNDTTDGVPAIVDDKPIAIDASADDITTAAVPVAEAVVTADDFDAPTTTPIITNCKTYVDLLPNEPYSPGATLIQMVDMHLRRRRGQVALLKWKQHLPNGNKIYFYEYVPFEWMKIHHPSMLIQFFETRLFFRNKHTGGVDKYLNV